MDLTEIESHLDRVEERHEEAECILVEARERDEAEEVYDMLDACEGLLEETSLSIEHIKGELTREGGLRCFAARAEGVMANSHDEMTPMLIQLLEVTWKQEQLEEAHEALSLTC